MTGPVVYALFPGNAREALEFYRATFGGDLSLHTYEEFGRTDGPADAIADGQLTGDVSLYGADAGADEDAVSTTGLMLSLLLGERTERGPVWFEALADGGRVLEPLTERPWGDWDGQVVDPYGLRWLIGFKPAS